MTATSGFIKTVGMPTADGYLADHDVWYRYPSAGDPLPPTGTKLLLLTKGGITVIGHWIVDGFFVAWSPLPKEDKVKGATWARDWASQR